LFGVPPVGIGAVDPAGFDGGVAGAGEEPGAGGVGVVWGAVAGVAGDVVDVAGVVVEPAGGFAPGAGPPGFGPAPAAVVGLLLTERVFSSVSLS